MQRRHSIEQLHQSVGDLGYRLIAPLVPGTRSEWVVRAYGPNTGSVVITRARDAQRAREEARALRHWEHSSVTPIVYDMPDDTTLVLQDLRGYSVSREPTRGFWSAREVGAALRILHDHPHKGVIPTAIPDDVPAPRLDGVARELADHAERALARYPGAPEVIVHGDMVPSNAYRAFDARIRLIDPSWRMGQRADDLARYAMLIPGGDVLGTLAHIWRGYGMTPTTRDLARTAQMLATHLQHVHDGALSPRYTAEPLRRAAGALMNAL